jgi:hypothetical protein
MYKCPLCEAESKEPTMLKEATKCPECGNDDIIDVAVAYKRPWWAPWREKYSEGPTVWAFCSNCNWEWSDGFDE